MTHTTIPLTDPFGTDLASQTEAENRTRTAVRISIITILAMIPFTLYGLFYSLRRGWRKVYPVLAYIALASLGDSIYIGNLGTMHRHRSAVWIFVLILTALGLERFLVKGRAKSMVDRVD